MLTNQNYLMCDGKGTLGQENRLHTNFAPRIKVFLTICHDLELCLRPI